MRTVTIKPRQQSIRPRELQLAAKTMYEY